MENENLKDVLDEVIGGPVSFGDALRSMRECEEWSQAEMAFRLGISPKRLSDLERGVRKVSLAAAVDFARRLGYPEHTFAQCLIRESMAEVGLEAEMKFKAGTTG